MDHLGHTGITKNPYCIISLIYFLCMQLIFEKACIIPQEVSSLLLVTKVSPSPNKNCPNDWSSNYHDLFTSHNCSAFKPSLICFNDLFTPFNFQAKLILQINIPGGTRLGSWWSLSGPVGMLIVASDASWNRDAAPIFRTKLWLHVKIYSKAPESFFSKAPNKRRLITFVSVTTLSRDFLYCKGCLQDLTLMARRAW